VSAHEWSDIRALFHCHKHIVYSFYSGYCICNVCSFDFACVVTHCWCVALFLWCFCISTAFVFWHCRQNLKQYNISTPCSFSPCVLLMSRDRTPVHVLETVWETTQETTEVSETFKLNHPRNCYHFWFSVGLGLFSITDLANLFLFNLLPIVKILDLECHTK
jgi:hypothetical protein